MSRKTRITTIPTHLKHEPIYAITSDANKDGFYNEPDVIGLSLGKAQWCNEDFVPSVKVWRDVQTNNGNYRVSRQSEETTLTRALDLATLVVKVCTAITKEQPIGELVIDNANVRIEAIGSNELLQQLIAFIRNDFLLDIKAHIDVLKTAIEELNK